MLDGGVNNAIEACYNTRRIIRGHGRYAFSKNLDAGINMPTFATFATFANYIDEFINRSLRTSSGQYSAVLFVRPLLVLWPNEETRPTRTLLVSSGPIVRNQLGIP